MYKKAFPDQKMRKVNVTGGLSQRRKTKIENAVIYKKAFPDGSTHTSELRN